MKPSKKLSEKFQNTLLSYLFAFYKVVLRAWFGNACQFHPSCSEYSQQAFKKFGIFKGLFLTTTRLLRCHPFCRGGYDPLPDQQEVSNG